MELAEQKSRKVECSVGEARGADKKGGKFSRLVVSGKKKKRKLVLFVKTNHIKSLLITTFPQSDSKSKLVCECVCVCLRHSV